MDPETRFRAVFDVAYGPLCRYARYRGLTGPDAEDLVAQTAAIGHDHAARPHDALLGTDTAQYQILPATPDNLSLLTPPIPPGFTRTASSPTF